MNSDDAPAESIPTAGEAKPDLSAVSGIQARATPASQMPGSGRMVERLVQVIDLPESLWRPDTLSLHLPPRLTQVYRECIERSGLTALSQQRGAKDSPVGGLTQQETDTHFAQQFSGSVARAQLALLDPYEQIGHVAEALGRILTGGTVAILDLPSGAGALALSLLSTVAELRARAVLPRHPLDVTVFAGELSSPARQYADELFIAIAPYLKEQAIFVKHTQRSWDVCDRTSTTRLNKAFMQASSDCARRLIAVSNFSGFLHRESKMDAAAPQLDEIFRYCSGGHSVAIWIEPHMNAATARGGVFDRLGKWVRKLGEFARIVPPVSAATDEEQASYGRTQAQYALPLKAGALAPLRLAVLQFDLAGDD